MSEQFKQTVERLPGILVKNSGPMMQRIVSTMQASIMADQQLPDASYCALLLKMTADDLASGFERAIKESMGALAIADANPKFSLSSLSLAIEPMEGEGSSEKADFLQASAAFDRLFAKGNALGVKGLRNYDRAVLLGCLKDAFAKSRMSPEEAGKMLPYARRALNDELVRLYAKLEAL